MENRVFSIFAKKSDKKFVFLEKKGIVRKRRMSQIFRREARGNRTEIPAGKICLRKTEKKLLLVEFSTDFYEAFTFLNMNSYLKMYEL